MASKSKKKYFNYVEYAYRLNSYSHEELQTEAEYNQARLRMCEQELRNRRQNKKTYELVKHWKSEEKDGANQGTK